MSRALSFVVPLLLCVSGCSAYVEEGVIVRSPHRQREVVYYGEALPPPPRVQVITVRPDPASRWEHGRWSRHGREWVWVGGRWRHG